jgi:hypothetical protein
VADVDILRQRECKNNRRGLQEFARKAYCVSGGTQARRQPMTEIGTRRWG